MPRLLYPRAKNLWRPLGGCLCEPQSMRFVEHLNLLFVLGTEVLLLGCPARILVTTLTSPSWITLRHVLGDNSHRSDDVMPLENIM